LEKAEGKEADKDNVGVRQIAVAYAPLTRTHQVSDMKALNAKFARLHGYSSLANLIAFLALAFHGLWIGNYGVTV
jgi:hypothetical protein